MYIYIYIYLVLQKTLTGFPKGCPIRGQQIRKPLGNLPKTYQETLGKPSFGKFVSQGFPKCFPRFCIQDGDQCSHIIPCL